MNGKNQKALIVFAIFFTFALNAEGGGLKKVKVMELELYSTLAAKPVCRDIGSYVKFYQILSARLNRVKTRDDLTHAYSWAAKQNYPDCYIFPDNKTRQYLISSIYCIDENCVKDGGLMGVFVTDGQLSPYSEEIRKKGRGVIILASGETLNQIYKLYNKRINKKN